MAAEILKQIKISGIACAVPTHKVDNEDFLNYYEKKYVDRFYKITGIKTRYWSGPRQTAADLCFVAAKKVLDQHGLGGDDIGSLIFLTQTPDYKTPSTAFVLQHRLGIEQDAVVFDINMGCTAFIHGIYVMAGLFQNQHKKYGLLLLGDSLPGRKVTEDHTDSMMFGDAGSAVLLEKSEDGIPCVLKSNGEGFQTIMNPMGERFPLDHAAPNWDFCRYYMDGAEVFNFAVNTMPNEIEEYLKVSEQKKKDFDYYVFHQANRFILRHLANDLDIPLDQVPISLDSYGNTNGASVPVTLVDMYDKGFFQEKKHLLICAFGIGMSWGILDIFIDSAQVLPMIFTEDYYEDGQKIKYLKK